MTHYSSRVVAVALAVAAVAWSEPAYAIDPDLLSINGYSSFEIEYMYSAEGEGDRNLSFDADLFDLVFNFRPTTRVRAAADVTWEHGSASEDGRGNVAVEYAFAEYTISDAFRVRAGKMFVPFGVFNELHTAKPAMLSVKEPPSTNKPERIVESDRFFPRWAVGLAMHGDAFVGSTHLDYAVQVSNGEQEVTNPFEEDNNLFKAVAGRVRLEAGATRVGASAYVDSVEEEDASYTLYSQGVQFEGYYGVFELTAEAVIGFRWGDGEHTQLGWFVQPALRLDHGLTPYVRFGYIDPNLAATREEGFTIVAGLNFEPARAYHLKLEHNYVAGGRESSLAELPGRDFHELKAAIVLGF